MSKPIYLAVSTIIHVPVYDCGGCAKRVTATPHAAEQNALHPHNWPASGSRIAAEPDALIATSYSPPTGWEHIRIPGTSDEWITENYFCPECAPVVVAALQIGIHAALHAVTIARNAGASVIVMPPLQGVPVVDERQAVIPHEFAPITQGVDVCDICRLSQQECNASQQALTATA